MNADKTARTGWESNLLKQTLRLAAWTAAWVATLALATFGAKFLWDGNRIFTALVIAISVVVGLGLIRAHRDHLLSLDELQQRIYLESMGIALGIGLIAGCAYGALDNTDVIAADADIGMLIIVMGLTYLGGVIYGNWKYR